MEFKVPLLPHLKKFIMGQLYKGLSEPIKVEEDSPLGRSIMSILIDGRAVTTSAAKHFKDREYSATFRITLSAAMAERSPRVSKLARLNLEFNEIFLQALYVWVKAENRNGVSAYVAVENFLLEYDIEENEYTKDAAYKAWQRYKSAGYKKKSRTRVLK